MKIRINAVIHAKCRYDSDHTKKGKYFEYLHPLRFCHNAFRIFHLKDLRFHFLFSQNLEKIFFDCITVISGRKSQINLIPEGTHTKLYFRRTCIYTKIPDILLIAFRHPDDSHVGKNSGHITFCRPRPDIDTDIFQFQRRKFQDWVYLQGEVIIHPLLHPFRCQFFFKACIYFLHNICELFFSTLKMISRFNPVEKIEHCIGRKEITQINRNHQYNRLAFLPSCHCPVNRTQIYRSQKYRHRHTISLCLTLQFFDRNFCLCRLQTSKLTPVSAKLMRCRFFLFFSVCLA